MLVPIPLSPRASVVARGGDKVFDCEEWVIEHGARVPDDVDDAAAYVAAAAAERPVMAAQMGAD